MVFHDLRAQKRGASQPVLNWSLTSDLGADSQGVVWRDWVTNKVFPRPSGFKHTDCNAMGHPGCVDGWECGDNHVCEPE